MRKQAISYFRSKQVEYRKDSWKEGFIFVASPEQVERLAWQTLQRPPHFRLGLLCFSRQNRFRIPVLPKVFIFAGVGVSVCVRPWGSLKEVVRGRVKRMVQDRGDSRCSSLYKSLASSPHNYWPRSTSLARACRFSSPRPRPGRAARGPARIRGVDGEAIRDDSRPDLAPAWSRPIPVVLPPRP